MRSFLSVLDLANLAGVSRQALEKALKNGRDGTFCWRGGVISYRIVRGVGGRCGCRYEIDSETLPEPLLTHWRKSTVGTVLPSTGPTAQVERDWWNIVLAPALGTEKHGRERGEAIRRIAAQDHVHPSGKSVRLSERTVQRRLDRLEAAGVAGLSRPKRVDAGTVKVILSRRWDAFAPLDDRSKLAIAEKLRTYVRSLIRAGEKGQLLALHAERELRELTVAAGVKASESELEAACKLPHNFFEAEKAYRKLRQFETDRKAFEDARPRIRRHRDGLPPMGVVVGDIHPLDIVCRREDGSTATPRAIAWLDVATNRIWLDLVLLEPGAGIRNAHVIASFIRMVAAWGMPERLYLDNGSEYRWAEFADDALKLVSRGADNFRIEYGAPGSQSHILRARPYNASAKPIEGIFAVLERKYFSVIPGWIGGDRLRKKTANVGRVPDPFPGTFPELQTLIAAQIELFHKVPQKGGSLKGKSPDGALAECISKGWEKTAVNADAFRIAFASEQRVAVRQGSVQCAGRRWTSPELQSCLDATVIALVPKYEEWHRLPIQRLDGTLLGFAEPDQAVGFLDRTGARTGRRRETTHVNAVRSLKGKAPPVDVLAERMKLSAEAPPAVQAPVGRTIGPTEDAKRIIARLNETPAERFARENREGDELIRQQLAIIERFNAMRGKNT